MSDIQWTTEKRRLCDLVAWERNPRQIKKAEADRLIKSLEQFGQIQTIAIGPDNQIYDGHQRKLVWAASQKFGADYEVDVRVSSRALTERERQQLVVYLHKGTVGEWDWDVLANEFEMDDLKDWGFTDFDFQLAGWDTDEEPPPDPGPQLDRAAELQEKWGTKLGQCWTLGGHRLVCGDCTDVAVVDAVMKEEAWALCFTSPPYAGGVNSGFKSDYYGKTKRFYVHDRDNISVEEWTALCDAFLRNAAPFAYDESSPLVLNVMYNANNRRGFGEVCFAGDHPFKVHETICWDKKMGFPSASRGILSRNWELVFVMSQTDTYTSTQKEHEVRWAKWEIARPDEQNESHRAGFPIKLAERAIEDYSESEAMIYDPFLGSGTTLIACERLGRRCRAIEIEPKYVAVTLQRWHDMTGRDPVLVSE